MTKQLDCSWSVWDVTAVTSNNRTVVTYHRTNPLPAKCQVAIAGQLIKEEDFAADCSDNPESCQKEFEFPIDSPVVVRLLDKNQQPMALSTSTLISG